MVVVSITFLAVTALVAGVLVFRQDKPAAELVISFVVNTGVSDKEPEIPSTPSVEASGVELITIDLQELRALKIKLEEAPAGDPWVNLEAYDLPEGLFASHGSEPGLFETAYTMKAGLEIRGSENEKSFMIISAVTECKPTLGSVLGAGNEREATTDITIANYLGSARVKEVVSQLKILEGFTVRYNPGLHAVRLVSCENVGKLSDVKMGIQLSERDVFKRHVSGGTTKNEVDVLSQGEQLDSINTISQSLDKGEIKRAPSSRGIQSYFGNYDTQLYIQSYAVQFIGAAIPEGSYMSAPGKTLQAWGTVNPDGDDFRANIYLEITIRP